jgi:hypothetical protein
MMDPFLPQGEAVAMTVGSCRDGQRQKAAQDRGGQGVPQSSIDNFVLT